MQRLFRADKTNAYYQWSGQQDDIDRRLKANRFKLALNQENHMISSYHV